MSADRRHRTDDDKYNDIFDPVVIDKYTYQFILNPIIISACQSSSANQLNHKKAIISPNLQSSTFKNIYFTYCSTNFPI